jgi:hypothetical protein
VQETRGGRYWLVSFELDRIRWDIFARRESTTEIERITEFADRAFTAFPDLIEPTIEDEARDMVSTAWMLRGSRVIDPAAQTPDEAPERTWRVQPSIAEIIIERARFALEEQ